FFFLWLFDPVPASAVRVLQPLSLFGIRPPPDEILPREGPRHFPRMQNDRARPACPQSMLHGQLPEIGTERIFVGICYDDGLLQVNCSSACAGIWADRHTICSFDECFGKAWSGAVTEVQTVVLKDQDGA